jgi:hypothetical protein
MKVKRVFPVNFLAFAVFSVVKDADIAFGD